MRYTLIALLCLIQSAIGFSQVSLTIEGREIIDSETGISDGFNIPRSQPTVLMFRNNSLTSVNAVGYILQAGDETPGVNNNNLDGAVITGNRFTWNGSDGDSWTHALFTGYNLGVKIMYNYLHNTPNGIQRKSDGMTDHTGVVAYNIIRNPRIGVAVKGMNGVRIFNNTFYTDKTRAESGRGLIDIYTNGDGAINAPSTGTMILNNIFYAKHNTFLINVMDRESLEGLHSDYNLFYCESGPPLFNAGGVEVTFSEWQALGYDLHSVVVDPQFIDYTDFVPARRLDYGTDLGSEFSYGLAVDAYWSNTSPATERQNGPWQTGARVYDNSPNENGNLPDGVVWIYPNPAKSFFYVVLTDMERAYDYLKIYDLNGRVVHTMPLGFARKNLVELPAGICSGIYTVSLESAHLPAFHRKIVIVN